MRRLSPFLRTTNYDARLSTITPPIPALSTSVPPAFSATMQKQVVIQNRIEQKVKSVEELQASMEDVSVSLTESRSRWRSLGEEHSEIESQLNILKVSEQEESQRFSSIITSIEKISSQFLHIRERMRKKRFEVEDSKDRADRVTRNLKRLENSLTEKKKCLEELKRTRKNIATRREQIREEREHYREMISERQTNRSVTFVRERSQVSSLKKEIENLSELIQEKKTTHEMKNIELIELKSKNDDADEQLRNLSSKSLQHANLEKEIEELGIKLREEEIELQDLRNKLSNHSKDRVSCSTTLDTQFSRLKHLEHVVRENERCISLSTQKRENLETEIRELRNEIEGKDTEISNKVKTLHETRSSLQRAQAKFDLLESKARVMSNEMNERVFESRQFSELSKHVQDRIEKLQCENVKSENDVEGIREELERLNEDEDIARNIIKRLREDLERLCTQNVDSQFVNTELRDSEIELKRIKEQTSRVLKDMSQKSQAREDVLSSLTSQIVSLKEKERIISRDNHTDDDEIETLAEELRDVNDSIANLRRNVWNVERDLSEKIQVLNSLRSETRVIETKIDGRNKELASLLETCPVIEARLSEELGETKLSLRQQKDDLSVRSVRIALNTTSTDNALKNNTKTGTKGKPRRAHEKNCKS